MSTQRNHSSGLAPESFVVSHCQKSCAAGWTRTSRDGGVLTVCLLDRELVWPEMVSCNRYEPKQPD
jgi:hypothetical protein